MTKKKSKKKIRKKQKSIKDGFEQDQEEQEKENPKKDAPAQKSEQSRVPDSIEPENQKLTAEKTAAIASYIKDPDYRLRCKAAIDILGKTEDDQCRAFRAEKTYCDQSDYQSDQKCGKYLRKTSEKRLGTGFRDSQKKSEGSHRHPCSLSV